MFCSSRKKEKEKNQILKPTQFFVSSEFEGHIVTFASAQATTHSCWITVQFYSLTFFHDHAYKKLYEDETKQKLMNAKICTLKI